MTTLLLQFPKHLIGFLGWWAYLVPARIFGFFEDFVTRLDGNLQLGANLRLWLTLEPLFGDYGWRGRMIGFLFRGARTFVTLLAYLAAIVLGLISLIGWILLLPAAVILISNIRL